MTEPDARTRWRNTSIWLGLLLGLTVLLWAVLVVYLPRQKKTFDEYNMMLPGITKAVLDVGMAAGRVWYLAAPPMLSAVGVGVLVGRHAFRRPTPGTVFAWVCLVLLAVAFAVILIGLGLPMVKLAEGMRK